MNIGAVISIKLDFETRIEESMKKMNQIAPGCRAKAYSPVFINLSPTPVAIYVLRKGRLINRAHTNIKIDIVSSIQPSQVDQMGNSSLSGARHIIINE